MARLPYEEGQSLRSMNTRQLRQFIADQADEAQKRIDTKPAETTRAFNELMYPITNRERTRIKRSTSNMTKAEMLEYAYDLQRFNRYDVESKYANKTDYQQNKKRYEKFVKNMLDPTKKKQTAETKYWEKYVLPSGRISKKGYQEYKDFISTLKATEEFLNAYGYRTIQEYAYVRENNLDPDNKILNRTLAKVYAESKGMGLTQSQLIERFKITYEDALDKEQAKVNKSSVNIPKVKTRKQKSKSNVKVKTTGKMRPSGKVRNKLS